MPLIGLITDFGNRGMHYTAQMKAVIKRINPNADIIDITHTIKPFNIIEAAFIIKTVYFHFPKGSIFIIVVDPGVGSSRDIVAVKTTDDYYFVGPDNGIFSYLQLEGLIDIAVKVEDSDFFYRNDIDSRNEESSEFDGENPNTEKIEEQITDGKEPGDTETEKIKKKSKSSKISEKEESHIPIGLLDASGSLDELLHIIDEQRASPEREKESKNIALNGIQNGVTLGDIPPIEDNIKELAENFDESRAQIGDLFKNIPHSSVTFQGRDIMAPVGAHLSNGLDLLALGQIKTELIVCDEIIPEIDMDNNRINGVIQYVDEFGNLITNIPVNHPMLATLPLGSTVKVQFHGRDDILVAERANIFSGHSSDTLLLLNGSSGFFELDYNQVSAALKLGIASGNRFSLILGGKQGERDE